MLRLLFAAILLFHGLIHLMGFAKAFKYAEITEIQLPISRTSGSFWLAAAVLFIISTILFLLKKDSWWMLAIPATLISQMLIFQYWQDAKFGAIANAIVLLAIILSWGSWNFNQLVDQEKAAFLPAPSNTTRPVLNREKMAALPPIVQRWLERSNCMGKPVPGLVQLRQTGRMRTSPKGAWMPFEAAQLIRTQHPGFFWNVKVQAAPFIQLVGRDKYEAGKGYMLIKAAALVTVADARGLETDQGALLRYLGELVWHPGTALADYIQWAEVPDDPLAARATMQYGDLEASGVFHFTPDGDVQGFETLRYYNRKDSATLEKWQVRVDPDSFREFEDIRIPARSTVIWLLETGEFTWLELELTDLKYPF